MISIATKGIKAVLRQIEKDAKQMRFAAAVALTRTAKIGAETAKKTAKRTLDEPTPFTLKGMRFKAANKANLTASVFIQPIQSEYLQWQIDGGKRKGRGGGKEFIPKNVKLNRYGNVPARAKGKIQQYLDRPDTFVGTVRGVYGVWQRGHLSKGGQFSLSSRRRKVIYKNGRKRVGNARATNIRLLFRLEKNVPYKPTFPFYKAAELVFNSQFERQFDRALIQAQATAR